MSELRRIPILWLFLQYRKIWSTITGTEDHHNTTLAINIYGNDRSHTAQRLSNIYSFMDIFSEPSNGRTFCRFFDTNVLAFLLVYPSCSNAYASACFCVIFRCHVCTRLLHSLCLHGPRDHVGIKVFTIEYFWYFWRFKYAKKWFITKITKKLSTFDL